MYNYEIRPNLQRVLKRLSKKENKAYERVIKKIEEIINSNSVEHYKNLKHSLKNFKRVQIGEKVLIFNYNKNTNTLTFEDLDHHDKIYIKKF